MMVLKVRYCVGANCNIFKTLYCNRQRAMARCLMIVNIDCWLCFLNTHIPHVQVGVRDSSYSDFLVDLHKKEGDSEDCRYGLYDYDYQFNPDGTESTFKSKLFLMSWCPDSAKIKKKMLYSSSFDTLKRAFVGVHKVIQANDKSECEQVTNL